VHEDLNKTPDRNAGYLESAVKDARAAHVADNHISAALIQLGQLLTKRSRYDDAIRAFQQGITLIQNDRLAACDEAGALYGMGGVYRSLDENDKAVPVLRDAYQRMRSCYGDSPFTLQTLGYWADAMIQSGHAKDALADLETSEPLWKTGSMNRVAASQNFVFLGRAYLAESQFKAAEQAAIHGFALIDGQVGPQDRGLGLVHLVWAMALSGQGQNSEAKTHADIADRILNNHPQSPSAKRWGNQAHELADRLNAQTK
jgi:tetratricopeptide (TPR) repeat protein